MTNTKHDAVNQPKHYTSCPSGIECIVIAELLPFCLGNCYKYLHRAGLKGDLKQDLEKARYYANRAFFNGEIMPERVKSRIGYVASHKGANNAELLAVFRLWGVATDQFITKLSEKIDQLGQNADKKGKIIGYRIGFMGYDYPVCDTDADQRIDSLEPIDM